ncbi:cell envelope integrity protein CreD [Dongia deserti]|uniref:cell envelope integrity protein CreD n=1 Tax=Dongia deserti TaxID=2268030 RepID=UPI000E655126|nr:cell envelope integrity protein CreD [Dongia deserti]
MSDLADPGPSTPTIQSMARHARRRFGGGWEAGKRVVYFAVLVLIMLVPLGMVEGVVEERAATKAQVAEEIGAQWGPPQTISGPLLVVPYEISRVQTNADGDPKTIFETRYAVFTPEELRIDASTGVQKRYKSIYEMLVYGADVAISGRFAVPDFGQLGVTPTQIGWDQASLVFGLAGVRAINAASLDAAGSDRQIEAGVLPYHPFADGIRASLPLQTVGTNPPPFEFAAKLTLNGRDHLSFQPLGRQSEVTITSDWPHPNFIGTPLPAKREIRADGFTASWSVSHIATGSPLSWLTHQFKLEPERTTTVGVALAEPGDVHQQTDRIVKYGILVIGLTFGTIFVVGLLKQDRVHLVQYLLIGASITLFYLLLLSLAEQMDFALSYVIASVVDITIVAWYAGATIRRLMGWVTGAVLALVHGYMYVLLQMESFALLSGAIGLLLALLSVMIATRKVDWFALGETREEAA